MQWRKSFNSLSSKRKSYVTVLQLVPVLHLPGFSVLQYIHCCIARVVRRGSNSVEKTMHEYFLQRESEDAQGEEDAEEQEDEEEEVSEDEKAPEEAPGEADEGEEEVEEGGKAEGDEEEEEAQPEVDEGDASGDDEEADEVTSSSTHHVFSHVHTCFCFLFCTYYHACAHQGDKSA
jgi:hypothetical protein